MTKTNTLLTLNKELLLNVATVIISHPLHFNMRVYGNPLQSLQLLSDDVSGETNDCSSPSCIAGWIATVGKGSMYADLFSSGGKYNGYRQEIQNEAISLLCGIDRNTSPMLDHYGVELEWLFNYQTWPPVYRDKYDSLISDIDSLISIARDNNSANNKFFDTDLKLILSPELLTLATPICIDAAKVAADLLQHLAARPEDFSVNFDDITYFNPNVDSEETTL